MPIGRHWGRRPPPAPPPPTNIYQAENATVVGATLHLAGGADTNPGYTGNGYVGDWGATGQYVEFTVTIATAATFQLRFRYRRANPGNATRALTIDGAAQGTLTFAQNANAWTDSSWTTVDAIATLAAGTRLIRLTHPGPDGDNFIDLDNLTATVTVTPPPPPPPPPGTADIRAIFLARYPHSATVTNVTGGGAALNNAINGAGAGGIISVNDSLQYDDIIMNGKNFAAANQLLVMAAIGQSPTVRLNGTDFEGNERSLMIQGSSYVGWYGFDIAGVNASGHSVADAAAIRGSHHVSIWECKLHDGSHGIGAAENGGFDGGNHYDFCYNDIYNNAWYNGFAGSGISCYKLANTGGGNDADGYSVRIIGNFLWQNKEIPGTTPGTDGNAIIIDIANGTYSSSAVSYLGDVLIANNIAFDNGGRGIHALFSNRVHELFNTCIHNMTDSRIARGGELSQHGSNNGTCKWNIAAATAQGQSWFNNWNDGNTQPRDNCVLERTSPSASTGAWDEPIAPNNRDRTGAGLGYFTAAAFPAGTTRVRADFTPDGGGGAVERVTRTAIGTTLANNLDDWPDALRVYRPATGDWALGAIQL